MPGVQELRPGLWHWEAPHPDWKPSDDWGELVSSYAIDDGERLLLFDPLALPSELEGLAAGRETAIVLTCPWHERDARGLAERLGATVHVASPEEGEPITGRQLFSAGDRLPAGIESFLGLAPNELVLWVEDKGAVVAGDVLVDRGDGLGIPADWVGDGLEQVRGSLRALLDLPVEHVLATHGGPTDRASLERALV
jgi:glyoxylase-like metal-dependent hydrolase (beta-lactamase superfamily II)